VAATLFVISNNRGSMSTSPETRGPAASSAASWRLPHA
jgi:hypothetical protein